MVSHNDGTISVRQEKTGKELVIPGHRDLQLVLDGIPRRVRDRGLVFHGLRKSAVVMLLEAGCTDAEVAAVTGRSRKMVEHYARQVRQKKLAAAAVLKWEAHQGYTAKTL